SLARWSECAPLGPLVGLPGMRRQLQRYVHGAAARMLEHATPLRSKCQVMQGWLHLFAGDLVEAQRCVDAAAADARWLANPADLDSPWRSLQAVLHALHGRRAESLGM